MQRLVTEAAATHLTNVSAGELVVEGDGATINGGEVGRLILDANDATAVLTRIGESLEVRGDRNTVNWNEGVEKPAVDTGADNVYTR